MYIIPKFKLSCRISESSGRITLNGIWWTTSESSDVPTLDGSSTLAKLSSSSSPSPSSPSSRRSFADHLKGNLDDKSNHYSLWFIRSEIGEIFGENISRKISLKNSTCTFSLILAENLACGSCVLAKNSHSSIKSLFSPLVHNILFYQFVNNFLALLLCKINFLDIFNIGDFFTFFL